MNSLQVKYALTEPRHVLWTACGMRQPEDTKFADLINELSKKIIAVSEYKVKNRNSKFSNHLSAVEAAVGGELLETVTTVIRNRLYRSRMGGATKYTSSVH